MVTHVEFQEHVLLAAKLAQADRLPRRAREGEVRRLLPHLHDEPQTPPHPDQQIPTNLIPPHMVSGTNESVQRQGVRAAMNLVNFLKGEKDYVQANQF